MRLKRLTAAICAMTVIFAASSCCNTTSTDDSRAKYIFLFIGDGMGNSHVAVTESYLSYKAGKLGGEQLVFTQFPVYGTCTTHSADKRITDSSASGTAISTGTKTNNSYLGVDPDLNDLKSMSYCLQEDGYRIGIMSSVPVNHATPASFYAHNKSRSAYYDITKWIPESDFEYFASAGILQYFGKDGQQQSSAEWLEENGYNVCFGKAELEEAIANDDRIVFCQEYNRDVEPANYDLSAVKPESETTLAEMVQYGIDFLSPEGEPFFIMCEGGEIDWAAHGQKTMPLITAMLGFNDAVKAAYDFYLAHPDETLIVITADHETGGVALGAGNHHGNVNWEVLETAWNKAGQSNTLDSKENHELNAEAHIGWTSYDHTGGAVPVYAIGKGAEKFSGRIDNTDIKGLILGE